MSVTQTSDPHPLSSLLERLPAYVWPGVSVIYGLGWFFLLLPSQVLWFLPAGLRLAFLWLLPAKRWGWLLVGEAIVAVILLWRSDNIVLNAQFVALSFSPWLVYAIVMLLIRGRAPGPELNTPRSMMAFLSCAFFSALAASPILSLLFQGDAFTKPTFDPGTWSSIFAFAYGDFIGQLIIAPLAILFSGRLSMMGQLSFWYHILAALLFSTLVLLLLHYRSDLAPFLLLLVFAPMFMLAFRKTWVGAAITISLIGVLFELYLQHNKLPLDTVITQLAFALFASGSLLLGAAMSAFRDTFSNLQMQHQAMAALNTELLQNSEQLRHLSQRIIHFEEQGQRELANELDAELGQVIHRLGTHLNLAIRSVKEPETYRVLSTVRDPLRDMEDSLRQVLQHLRPRILDEKGLSAALSAGPLIDMLSDANIKYSIDIEGPVDLLNETQAATVYRICQVAVRKACKLGIVQHIEILFKAKQQPDNTLTIDMHIIMSVLESASQTIEAKPLGGIRDRVLALAGNYEVSTDRQRIHHRIGFEAAAADT